MSAIPVLQKKLKSVRATKKLSKALKTVSSVKFARLSSICRYYADYADEFGFFLRENDTVSAPDLTLVMGSNEGFCGAFNERVLSFLKEKDGLSDAPVAFIGHELTRLLTASGFTAEEKFTFSDVPETDELKPLFDWMYGKMQNGRLTVRIIRPMYENALVQLPGEEIVHFEQADFEKTESELLYFPDRKTAEQKLYEKAFQTSISRAVFETAMGAQAATLFTMRSAFDAATAYCESLEKEIQRIRQTEVTADVLETSGERGDENGRFF